MHKRVLDIKVLPDSKGRPSGTLCIHLFVVDPNGILTEPCVTQVDHTKKGSGLTVGPLKGRLACDHKRRVAVVHKGNVTSVTLRTGDPRATTCPRCLASKECQDMMRLLNGPSSNESEQQGEEN